MPDSLFVPILGYFRTLRALLTEPTRFFQQERTLRIGEDPSAPGLPGALAFALATHWISEAISYLWRESLGRKIMEKLEGFIQVFQEVTPVDGSLGRKEELQRFGEEFLHWFWGVGSVVIDPFVTTAKLLAVSLLLFVGGRILITPARGEFPQVTYERIVRITCFAISASILGVIPIVGTLVAPIVEVILLTIGVREVFGTSTGRATVVACFPQLLLIGTFFAGILAVFLFFAKLVTSLI